MFNPKDVTETQVGSASFIFTDANHATLTYVVSGARVTKSIVRYTYAAPPIAGTYWIAGSGLAARCDASGSFTYRYDNAGMVLAVTGPRLDLVFKLYNEADWDAAYSCTAGGPFAQWGSQIAFSAPYSCSDGISGTLAIPDLSINESGLVGRLVWTHGPCVESENVAGVRHPVTPTPRRAPSLLVPRAIRRPRVPPSALVTVLRTGGSSGTVSVGYVTSDGTAKAGEDYTARSAT